MTDWITRREAAGVPGVAFFTVGKMVARGELPPRPGRWPSLDRTAVEALAAAR